MINTDKINSNDDSNTKFKYYTWTNGKFVSGYHEIPSINFVMHYSSPSAWEGIRSYKDFGKKNTNIVGLKEHIDRLYDSAKIIGFDIPFTRLEIVQACKELVRKNRGGDLYLRPIAYASKDAERVTPKNTGIYVDIYAFPIPKLHSTNQDGIKMGFSSYTRGYPQFQMQAKTTPNYVHMQLCEKERENTNYDDLFLTDNHGYITEALVANVFVCKNGVLMTPPNDGSILPGITRKNVYNIFNHPAFKAKILGDTNASKLPHFLVEKKITKADLLTADEVFICGTYAEIVPVVQIEGRLIGDGKVGRFTQHIRQAYKDAVRAKNQYGVTLEKV